MRLDQYLVEAGHFESRARAQAAINDGLVLINGAPAKKASAKVSAGTDVDVAGDVHPYVSRGGVKLARAIEAMAVAPAGQICLDLGASTGGFCDVLLRAGAVRVYAVDVGTGQLHLKIASDERVINLEKTHAKDLSTALIPDAINLIVCDVSFISLKKALPPALMLAGGGARLIALVKPQFEVGREKLGKGGIVSLDDANRAGEDLRDWLEQRPDWRVTHFIDSPILGGDGNKEFLVGAVKSDTPTD